MNDFTNPLMKEVVHLARTSGFAGALDRLYSDVGQRLEAEDFDSVNDMISDVVQFDVQPELMIGLLTITLPWKNRLSMRHSLFLRTMEPLVRQLGLTRAEAALRGLR